MVVAADVWTVWRTRWDLFQESYVPERDLQLELIARYVKLARPREPLRVLDLCSGPGSAGARIVAARPSAEVVAVDWDPWLLELGRRTGPAADGTVWVEANLRDEAWVAELPRREFEAVVATTAMQWFDESEVARIYRDVARLLQPGGVFATADVTPAGSPAVGRLAQTARAHSLSRAIAARPETHWAEFWSQARGEPAFAEVLAERDRRFEGRHPRAPRPLAFHERALADAGFSEIGEVWRQDANAIVVALR
jgi:ubiquinone/menaquinone biosynthesis C-methylase UbiE